MSPSLFICDACGFIFHPEPETPPLTPVFDAMSDADAEKALDDHITERATYIKPDEAVSSFLKPGWRSLDVGSEYGIHVKLLRDSGLDSMGIEPNIAKRRAGIRRWNLNVIEGYYAKSAFPPNSFDFISRKHSPITSGR